MTVTLHHHPFSRATTVVWMLEETGIDYELGYMDLRAGEQKAPAFLAKNPMGKLPTLEDGDVVVTEAAAIGLYLADRYASERLAPALDDPKRGAYLRWSLFAPSVIEPGLTAKAYGWEYKPAQVGWGTIEDIETAIEFAIGSGPYMLGERFTMVDCIFGGTVRFMLQFKMLDPRPAFSDYVARLEERPALQRADAINQSVIGEHDLGET